MKWKQVAGITGGQVLKKENRETKLKEKEEREKEVNGRNGERRRE